VRKKIRTTVEITDRCIKLFQAEKAHGKYVVLFGDLPPAAQPDDGETVKLLREMVSSLPAHGEEFILLVPRRGGCVARPGRHSGETCDRGTTNTPCHTDANTPIGSAGTGSNCARQPS
jgi:hypothetical protein